MNINTKSKQFKIMWSQAVLKAWEDSEFKKRLLLNAKSAFKELGFIISVEDDIKVSEKATGGKNIWVLPPKPIVSESASGNLLKMGDWCARPETCTAN